MLKAPEFWDQMADDKVCYHRNVDVYTAGLTFTAMMQAKPGQNLVPKPEYLLLSSESKPNMPLGFVAFTRMLNQHSDINVMKDKAKDDKSTKLIKEIIRGMTHVPPQKDYHYPWLRPT